MQPEAFKVPFALISSRPRRMPPRRYGALLGALISSMLVTPLFAQDVAPGAVSPQTQPSASAEEPAPQPTASAPFDLSARRAALLAPATARPLPCTPRERELHWFRGPLAAAYLAPPVGLALVGLVEPGSRIWPSTLAIVASATPALMHSAYGDSTGAWYTILGMLSSVAVGSLTGVAIGHLAPGELPRDKARERDALTFGTLAYAGWALLDVAFFAYHEEPAAR